MPETQGGQIEALLISLLEQMASAMPAITLALVRRVPHPGGSGVAWRSWCATGTEVALARQIAIHALEDQHPLNMAARQRNGADGPPMPSAGTLFAARHWIVLPINDPRVPLPAEGLPAVVLVGFHAQPWAPEQVLALRQLAREVGLILAGAEAGEHEPRETDQLALLMRYAANPIILSDTSTIISMNEPATRLFDVSPTPNPEELVSLIARNLQKLRAYLIESEAATREVYQGELHLEDPRTQEELIMVIASSHIPDALGGRRGTVSVLHDMTRARELEAHRLRQQLFESEKLAATGRMAASIAHEINNPLEAIKNSLYLLVRQTGPQDPNRQFLELAQRETERVSRIIRQMLGVSRPSVTFALTDVNDVLQEALQLLGPQLRQGKAVLTVQLDDHLPLVRASADQLKQVFLNLMLNAREAMPNGGGILIQTRMAHEGDAEFLAGKHVIIRIRDDGNGIPPEILPHVFEPFFSTKTELHGTGLGLWVCQDIIQHHGGHIIARSMVGRGTTFLVALPFIASSADA